MRFKFLFLVLSVLVFTGPVFAQVAMKTGSIYGRVLDDQKQPLPGVTVTLESEVMPAQVATTSSSGLFRFVNLPPGTYSVGYSIEGYAELQQTDIQVSTGRDIELEVTLNQNTVIIEVNGDQVDARKVTVQQVWNHDALLQTPNSRDPWSLIDESVGVDSDRYSVAGSESGQQAGFLARGGSDDNTIWNYDGVNATDPGALGASPTYFDFESFEEVQIVTAGNDASVPTGGVVVNIVTKRAGNKWEANGSYFFVNDSLQGSNTPEELKALGQEKSNRLDQVKDYGFDLGGPIVKDKLFAWGAYRRNDISLFTVTGLTDKTTLTDYNFKTTMSWNSAHESQFGYFNGTKEKSGRGFNPFIQAPETLWEQGGTQTILPGIWTGQHTWIPNDHTIITGRYGYIGLGFTLIPEGGKDKPIILLAAIPRYENTSFFIAPIDRPAHDVVVDANYFKERILGGDHELKFGFEYKTSKLHTFSSYGNGIEVVDYYHTSPGGPLTSGYLYAQHFIDGRVKMDHTSFYVTDTVRMNRFTTNLGLRFDHQTGKNLASTIPGVPGFEDVVGPLDFPGNNPGVTFNDFSPRIGVTYDLTGDGKTVLRGNFARYYDPFGPAYLTHSNPTFVYNGAIIAFNNSNGDRIITRDEITGSPFYYGGLNGPIFDLAAFNAKKRYAEDLSNSHSNEFIVGFERQVARDLSVSLNFTHRDYGNFNAILPLGVSAADFIPAGNFSANTVLGNFSTPVYTLPYSHDGTLILRNIDDYQQTYNGVDIAARKRMSNNFMLNGSMTIQRQIAHYNGPDAAAYTIGDGGISGLPFPFDPGSIPFLDGQPYAFAPGGSGKSGVYPYSEWQLKMSGVYQLPLQFTIGAFGRYQQGYPYVLFGTVIDSSLSQPLGTTRHLVLVEPFGSRRFDNIFTLDLQLEKGFDFGGAGRLSLSANLFNVTNSNTVIRRTRSVSSRSLNSIEENISPRALRLGARYSF